MHKHLNFKVDGVSSYSIIIYFLLKYEIIAKEIAYYIKSLLLRLIVEGRCHYVHVGYEKLKLF